MNTDSWKRAKQAFNEALDQPESERESIIESRCGDDSEAAAEAVRMLKHAVSSVEDDRDPLGEEASEPRRIGRFRIVELLGSGASSMVYRARDPQRPEEVAIKVLRLAIASERGRRRLEYEGEILSALDHHGIARVFEIGSTKTAFGMLPYIAMELVEGVPIDIYAEEQDLDDRARIGLVARVCDAMAYAHRRGVIHRDLKPANILVDRERRPRVLDFGVARSIVDELLATTISVHTGEVLGTPGYMSPEQCAGASAVADTRADVYSLGVILFELLARERLFDVAGLPVLAALDIVRRAEPPLIGSVHVRYRGAIEHVLAKAMARDPRKRYESAALLGEDLRRALRGETVIAAPVSTLGRVRRVLRPYRGWIAVALVGAVVLSGSVIAGSMYQEWRVRQQAAAEAQTRLIDRTLVIMAAESLPVARAQLHELNESIRLAQPPPADAWKRFDALGYKFMRLGDPVVAADMYGRALDAIHRFQDRDHDQCVRALQVYTEALSMSGRSVDAEVQILDELEWWGFAPERFIEGDDQQTRTINQRLLRLTMTLGEAIGRQGRHAEGIALLRRVLAAQVAFVHTEEDGSEHADLRETRRMIAYLEWLSGQREDSEG